MVLAWLPALLVLGGRMYVRPETLSLLYLSIYLAVLFRWDRFPALAWLLAVRAGGVGQLPGPVRAGADRPGLRAWSTRPSAAAPSPPSGGGGGRPSCRRASATGLACLLNPYGITGRSTRSSWPGR